MGYLFVPYLGASNPPNVIGQKTTRFMRTLKDEIIEQQRQIKTQRLLGCWVYFFQEYFPLLLHHSRIPHSAHLGFLAVQTYRPCNSSQ